MFGAFKAFILIKSSFVFILKDNWCVKKIKI